MTNDFCIQKMANRLKELRLKKGLGQNYVAHTLNLCNSSISYWENAKQEPSASALYKLAKFYEVSADYLLGVSPDSSDDIACTSNISE